MFVPDDISVNHSSTHLEPDLFAHAVDDLQVLRTGQKHVRVHSNVVVQKRHHICDINTIHTLNSNSVFI